MKLRIAKKIANRVLINTTDRKVCKRQLNPRLRDAADRRLKKVYGEGIATWGKHKFVEADLGNDALFQGLWTRHTPIGKGLEPGEGPILMTFDVNIFSKP